MGGLKQLDEVNGRVRDRYKALADGAGRLLGGEHVGAVYADIANYTKQIESTEEKVSNLELLVEELERLADELG
ncbi:MAG: hypothetical protein M1840_003029 [Geoglossum simile]|nr:MAG: hypothetical protein M1840_003029 [Geoglossum simile]